jgi:inhibitor of cysteine peptidase
MMRRVLLPVLVAAAAVLVLGGCAARGLELTAEDNGTAQTLAIDQELTITLEANPSTGYAWEIDGQPPGQLEQLGEPEFSAESKAIGAGGTQVWRFRAAESGKGELKLKYWRSFEPTVPPIETFSVTVSVD